jgi:hypothetical protein
LQFASPIGKGVLAPKMTEKTPFDTGMLARASLQTADPPVGTSYMDKVTENVPFAGFPAASDKAP